MEHIYSKKLKSLIIFRNIIKDEAICKLIALNDCDGSSEDLIDLYCDFASTLLKEGGNLTRHILKLVLEDDNIYIHAVISDSLKVKKLNSLLSRELNILQDISEFDGEYIRKAVNDSTLFSWETEKISISELYKDHILHIKKRGIGIFSKYHMFILSDSGRIVPIKHPDPQNLNELYGYEKERGKIIKNTKALLEGKPANNVLLYGDAGTGKSSTIKAIANEFKDDGLRLVELKKNQLYLIPELIDSLSENPLKFILFLDDLTFTSDDRDFCTLKAILEGGISSRSQNVAIYVTSNHRHLIKETLQDRQGDEISIGDKLQEMTSLSARFGLSITFSRPNKDLYQDIVQKLAKEKGIKLEENLLNVKSEAFAIRHGGRNPRTAKQFIDLLASGVEE